MRTALLAFVLLLAGCASETFPWQPAHKYADLVLSPADDPRAPDRSILAPFQGQADRDNGVQHTSVAVAAAISGGGHRAGNFATGVLLGLEDYVSGRQTKHNLLAEIDYFSTVSGGGLAAGNYLADLRLHLLSGRAADYRLNKSILTRDMQKRLRCDLEVTFWAGFTTWKIPFGTYDRGDGLEREIDNRILHHDRYPLSLRLGEMFVPPGKTPPQLPALIANTTVYGCMEIFPFTPNMLAYVKARTYTHRFDKYRYRNDDFYFEVPLAVGVKASASFPGVFPCSNLRCDQDPGPFRLHPLTVEAAAAAAPTASTTPCYLHLQDGGVAENIGYKTALSMLRRDADKPRVLLVVDAYQGVDQVPWLNQRETGPSVLEVVTQQLVAGLESRHRTLRDDVAHECGTGENRVQAIYFSFAEIFDPRRDDYELVPAVRALPAAMLDTSRPAALVLRELQKLVGNIDTRLILNAKQQQLLLAAGRQVVHNQRQCLDSILLPFLQP